MHAFARVTVCVCGGGGGGGVGAIKQGGGGAPLSGEGGGGGICPKCPPYGDATGKVILSPGRKFNFFVPSHGCFGLVLKRIYGIAQSISNV